MASSLFRLLVPALLTGAVVAQPITFVVPLSGDQEVPAVSPAGSGTANVSIDPTSGAVTVTGSYSGMTSPVVAAHIHGASTGALARRGANAGVFLGLTPTGGTSGTFSGSGTLNPTQTQLLLQGLAYVNVHSQKQGLPKVVPEASARCSTLGNCCAY